MIQNEIVDILKPLIVDLGYELWGCEYIAQGRHSLLRIYIDKEDGINIKDCENVSKQVSAFLDVEDIIPGHFSLEISSPGIPRPLFYLEQYKQYLGHDIQVKVIKPINGSRKFSGKLVSVDDNLLSLVVGEEQISLPFSLIVKANLIGE